MVYRNMMMGAAALWLVGCNDGVQRQPQPTEPLADLIAPSTASKLADRPEFERLYQLASTQMDYDHVNNTYDLLKAKASNLPAELEYIYRISQTSLYGRTSIDILEGIKGLYELAEQGYPYPLLNYTNNEDRGGKERVPYMIPDASLCELPRYQRACGQYPVEQVKWQAYVNWARETGDPWAYWNQWHLYAQESAFEAEGLAVLKEGVDKGCRLCAAGVAEYYYEQLEQQPTAPEQGQWQQAASDYLAIARQGTLACEPGIESLILEKGSKTSESVFFKHTMSHMAPMNEQEQRNFYQACLKLGNENGLGYAVRTFITTGVGPKHDVMLAATTSQAMANVTALRASEINEALGISVRLAFAMTHLEEGSYEYQEDIGRISDEILKNKKIIKKVIDMAEEIQKKLPYWGVRNYNNPAKQTINQRFYTLGEMRNAGMRFSFDPPKEQTEN